MRRSTLKSIAPIYWLYGSYRWLDYQIELRLTEREDRRHPELDAGPPVPPARLRHRVHGDLNREGFLDAGSRAAQDLRAALASAGLDIGDFGSVLDFGCGCARVLRFLADESGGRQLFGTDIDPQAIAWCQTNIKYAIFDVNGSLPPTSYADESFDFIYAISVFTHLDEEMQLAWLRELRRITRLGGYLMLTVRPPGERSALTQRQAHEFERLGTLFVVGQTGALKLDSLPDFYQTAYHSKAYVEQIWGKELRFVDYFERAICEQDGVLLQRPSDG